MSDVLFDVHVIADRYVGLVAKQWPDRVGDAMHKHSADYGEPRGWSEAAMVEWAAVSNRMFFEEVRVAFCVGFAVCAREMVGSGAEVEGSERIRALLETLECGGGRRA